MLNMHKQVSQLTDLERLANEITLALSQPQKNIANCQQSDRFECQPVEHMQTLFEDIVY